MRVISIVKKLCLNGYAHHVAVTLSEVGDIVYEALSYLGYNISFHNNEN